MFFVSYFSCVLISFDFWFCYLGFFNIVGIILVNCGKSMYLIYMLIGMINYFYDIYLKGLMILESNFISRMDVRWVSCFYIVKCEFI